MTHWEIVETRAEILLLPLLEQPLFSRAKELIASGDGALSLGFRLSGMAVQEYEGRHVMFLGARAGTEPSLSDFLHELGHLIDIDETRVLEPGWGLHYPEKYIAGRRCVEPATTQGCRRECRVVTWQMLLADHIGLLLDVDDIIRSFQFLPDFPLIPGKGRTWKEKQESRHSWLLKQVERNLRNFSIEEALRRLRQKCLLVKERLRTE